LIVLEEFTCVVRMSSWVDPVGRPSPHLRSLGRVVGARIPAAGLPAEGQPAIDDGVQLGVRLASIDRVREEHHRAVVSRLQRHGQVRPVRSSVGERRLRKAETGACGTRLRCEAWRIRRQLEGERVVLPRGEPTSGDDRVEVRDAERRSLTLTNRMPKAAFCRRRRCVSMSIGSSSSLAALMPTWMTDMPENAHQSVSIPSIADASRGPRPMAQRSCSPHSNVSRPTTRHVQSRRRYTAA
jgi:hypothetical protein